MGFNIAQKLRNIITINFHHVSRKMVEGQIQNILLSGFVDPWLTPELKMIPG